MIYNSLFNFNAVAIFIFAKVGITFYKVCLMILCKRSKYPFSYKPTTPLYLIMEITDKISRYVAKQHPVWPIKCIHHFLFWGYTDKYRVICRIELAFSRKTAGFIRQFHSSLTINRLSTLIYVPQTLWEMNIFYRFLANTGSRQSKSAIYTCKVFLFHQLKYKNQTYL